MSKIQESYFDIEFINGNKNVVDALSRKPIVYLLDAIIEDWKVSLLVEYSQNKFTFEVMGGIIHDEHYTMVNEFIYCKGRIYLLHES